jgi:hypothetical protein
MNRREVLLRAVCLAAAALMPRVVLAGPKMSKCVDAGDAADFTLAPHTLRAAAAGASSGADQVLTLDSIVPLPKWVDPQTGLGPMTITFGKHSKFAYNDLDRKVYIYGGDGTYPPFGLASSAMRFHRLTPEGAFDNFYPYWGKPGKPFPVGADCCPFAFDASRGCYWAWGGYYPGPGSGVWDDKGGRIVGIKKRYGIWRFWLKGPLAGEWEEVSSRPPGAHTPAPPANAPSEGEGGIYYPRLDCLLWVKGGGVFWYKCATGETGGVKLNISPAPWRAEAYQMDYDPKNDELFWTEWTRHGSVFATNLSKLPASVTTRTLLTGLYKYPAGQTPPVGQVPVMFRPASRKLYMFTTPAGYHSSQAPVGPENKSGIFEIDVDTLAVRTYPHPSQLATPSANFPAGRRFNEAAYCLLEDRIVATPNDGDHVFLMKWSPPTWTPTAGNVKAITKDVEGNPVNSIEAVKPYSSRGSKPVYGGVIGVSAMTRAWASAAYARDFSMNGAMLCHSGGDGDYWGNEVYAFDFDKRRWERLSDPTTAMSGNKLADAARDPKDPLFFDKDECEHGPAAGHALSGPLPSGTQPGVPHTYDGLVWVPGSIIGNTKGALLRPHSTFVYTTRSTGRAHYFDLDRKVWGRFSNNRAAFSRAQIPVSGYDEERQRIYHGYGYLDLVAKQQVPRRWRGIAYTTSSVFDPKRRLWLMANYAYKARDDFSPGILLAFQPDQEINTPVPLAMSGAVWPRCYSMHAGLLYCPDLDCFFLYSQGAKTAYPYSPNEIFKITPPNKSPLASAWMVEKVTMNGDALLADTKAAGSYKRVMWVPSLKSIAIFNRWDSFVYLYKPNGL